VWRGEVLWRAELGQRPRIAADVLAILEAAWNALQVNEMLGAL